MGVRQLQSYMEKYVSNGYINVSLIDECESFRRQNNIKPILLIDLHAFLRILHEDLKEVLCGIRHQKVYERLDRLLYHLSQIAELVFYDEGPLCPTKLPAWISRQNHNFNRSSTVLELIYQQKPLQEIIKNVKDIVVPITHLEIVEFLAQKYGTLKTALDKECDTEMAQFACQNPRVLAILADDSDFLIFPGNWRYFSLHDLNHQTLDTKEYSRKALRENLDLNDQELILLSTLNGNDVISFDRDTFYFHKSLIEKRYLESQRFPVLARYIKDHHFFDSINLFADVAERIFVKTFKEDVKGCTRKVYDSFELYDVEYKIFNDDDATKNFCRQHAYYFVYSVLCNMPIKLTFNYFDQYRSINFFTSVNTLFRKEIGIILKDEPLRRYKVCTKMSNADQKYSLISFNPITPKLMLPPLIELLDRLNYPQHDELRFKLLKWMICDKKFNFINFESIPQNIYLDILALIYMVQEKFISIIEADIVFLSIMHVESGYVPEVLDIPEVLHPRAFCVSFLFTYCHYYVTRCLEVTGLKGFVKLLNFDGVLFHRLYYAYICQPFDERIFGDFAKYRHYV